MTFNPELFKQQFPLFSQAENKDLIYLDNAATTQKPQCVIDAICHFYRHSNANAHRASHRLARAATSIIEKTRQQAAFFLGADNNHEVIFCQGATQGLNIVANGLCQKLQPGDEIILSVFEHHANLVPWQMMAKKYQLQLKFINELSAPSLKAQLTANTKIVSLSAASNALGCQLDIAAIKTLLSKTDIIFVLDASQLAAHQPINVKEFGCDFLVCSAHKFYGPSGIGLLYGKQQHLATLEPLLGGGEMINRVELESSSYAAAPHRFEAGTSALAAIAGLSACFDFWQQQDRQTLHQYEQQLCHYLHQKLKGIPTLQLLTQADNNLGIAACIPALGHDNDADHWQPSDLAHWLDEHDIAVRTGHHCAQPLMKQLKTEATLRISICAYNSFSDIDRLVTAIEQMPCIDNSTDANIKSSADDLSLLSLEHLQEQKGWQQRYRLLMKWGDQLSRKDKLRCDKYLIQGCESPVWLKHQADNGRHSFQIDSDSRIIKGLSVLLLLLINNKTQTDIQQVPFDNLFVELGLSKHLSESRNNGFRAMINRAIEQILSSENSELDQ